MLGSIRKLVAVLAEQKCDLIHPNGAPPFMVHGYSNNGTVPAVFSSIVDREMAEFIETEGVTEQPQGSPSPETVARMRAAANAHGITILAA